MLPKNGYAPLNPVKFPSVVKVWAWAPTVKLRMMAAQVSARPRVNRDFESFIEMSS